MRLTFPELDSASRGSLDARSPQLTPDPPIFSQITSFKTAGVVMNVFLLDPPGRLLACFVWVSEPNTIGLYTLLDWDTREYAFIDTGIECVRLAHLLSTFYVAKFPYAIFLVTNFQLVLHIARRANSYSLRGG